MKMTGHFLLTGFNKQIADYWVNHPIDKIRQTHLDLTLGKNTNSPHKTKGSVATMF